MGEMKPTPGPWWTDEYGGLRHGSARENDTVPVEGVALISGSLDSPRVRQARANRDLLLEAGTVFHNTSLSPVQLLDLLKAIIAAADSELAQGGEMWFAEAVAPPIDDARAALAKCEGVK